MIVQLTGYQLITSSAMRAALADPALAVFDVNSLQSWQRAHVPGARHLDPKGFGRSDLPDDQQTHLVFYCSNFFCAKAPQSARRARAMGFTRISVLATGISGWISSGAPTESAISPA
jgi:rhodanese-related sulfurtransferase